MGNFLPQVRNYREARILLIRVIKIYLVVRLARLLVWTIKNLRSRAEAKKMLKERNEKHYSFQPVEGLKAELILGADVTGLREHLMAGRLTSVELVNFFGHRCQTIGRANCYSTEELFESAMELAKKCDQERKEAIQSGKKDSLPFLHGIPVSSKEQI